MVGQWWGDSCLWAAYLDIQILGVWSEVQDSVVVRALQVIVIHRQDLSSSHTYMLTVFPGSVNICNPFVQALAPRGLFAWRALPAPPTLPGQFLTSPSGCCTLLSPLLSHVSPSTTLYLSLGVPLVQQCKGRHPVLFLHFCIPGGQLKTWHVIGPQEIHVE